MQRWAAQDEITNKGILTDVGEIYRLTVETKVEETWFAQILDCRDTGFIDRGYKSILCNWVI